MSCQKSIHVCKTHRKSICLLAWRSADLKKNVIESGTTSNWTRARMIKYFKSDAAEAEGGDDGAGDATDPSAANDSDDLCTLLPLPLSKLSLSKEDDPEDLSLLQYFRVKCYAVLIFFVSILFCSFCR